MRECGVSQSAELLAHFGDNCPSRACMDLTLDIPSLRALQYAHMLSIPFENLDIHLGRKIVLDEALLFNKIVERRRGISVTN